jgi:hypothetical protein
MVAADYVTVEGIHESALNLATHSLLPYERAFGEEVRNKLSIMGLSRSILIYTIYI